MKTGIEGTPVMFVDVNTPAFIERMAEMQTGIFEKFVQANGYIHKDSYLSTKEAARFLGLDVEEVDSNNNPKYRQQMSRFNNPDKYDPPLPVIKDLACDKYKVADLIDFADRRRIIKRKNRR